MFILTRELAITGLRGIAVAQGVVIDAGQEGKIKTVFVTVGTCALIMHYDYYIDVGFYQGVISCMEVGLIDDLYLTLLLNDFRCRLYPSIY